MAHIRKHSGLIVIAALSAIVMAGVAFVDRQWTIKLHENKWPLLEQWMNRSIFDGNLPSINDAVLLYIIALVLMYYAGWRSTRTNRFTPWRAPCGFALSSTLINAVYLVHSLKWIVGRARPNEVLYQNWAFSHWFAFGPHFITDGIYHGSFPSGHTAQTFILMTMAYILAGDTSAKRWMRTSGWIWGAVCLGLCTATTAARSMSLSHWVSDCVGSVALGWLSMHLLYHYVFRIPDQQRYFKYRGKLPDLPPVWEIVLCIYLLVGFLGIMGVLLGTKALIIDQGPWLALMVPIGAILIWIARQKTMGLLNTVWNAIDA